MCKIYDIYDVEFYFLKYLNILFLYELKHVNCAFRHPTGGVAWESLLEHQHICSKCLIINMLTVPSGIRLEV